MASVTKCDVCNSICDNKETKFLEISRVDGTGVKGLLVHTVDLCPTCYAEVCKMLKLEAL